MESNDSPEIPDRGETSDIPGHLSGEMQRNLSKRMWDIVTQQPGHVLLLPFLSQARRVWQLDGVFGLAVTPLGNLAESNV